MKKEKKQKKSPLMFLLSVVLLELVLVLLFLPKGMLLTAREKEAQMVGQYLGVGTEKGIKQTADIWYHKSLIETGFLDATYNYFGKYDDDGVVDDRGLGIVIDRRLDVFWLTLHLVYYRVGMLMIWLPYLLPMVLVASIDGLLQREIRKWQFSFSSPMAHRSAARLVFLIALAFVVIPFLPFPTPPFAMPILMGLLAVAAWVNLANIQKRI